MSLSGGSAKMTNNNPNIPMQAYSQKDPYTSNTESSDNRGNVKEARNMDM